MEGVETLQTKWDREHDIKLRENATFGSNVKNNPNKELFFELNVPGIFGRVSFAQQDCSVGCRNQVTFGAIFDYLFLRSYMEGKGRGAELKQQQGEEKDKGVKDIMKSITNVKNDRAKKEQAKKWSNMPAETKGKVIGKWEEKAKAAK